MNWNEILSSIGARRSSWKLLSKELSGINNRLRAGKDISEEELIKIKTTWTSESPFIDSEGLPFVLYIGDQNFHSLRGYTNPKFHVCWCSTLSSMQNKGRFARYRAKYDIDDDFFDVYRPGGDRRIKLEVCKNCLREMNINSYANRNYLEKDKIYHGFEMVDFFGEFGKQRLPGPTHQHVSMSYPDNWSDISRKRRKELSYTCQRCGKKCKDGNGDLHVHHKNGVKGDTRNRNLEVLCKECHIKEHPHMRGLKKNVDI